MVSIHKYIAVLFNVPDKQAKEDNMPLDEEPEIPFFEVHEIVVPHLGHVPIVKGDFTGLPKKIQQFIAFYVSN